MFGLKDLMHKRSIESVVIKGLFAVQTKNEVDKGISFEMVGLSSCSICKYIRSVSLQSFCILSGKGAIQHKFMCGELRENLITNQTRAVVSKQLALMKNPPWQREGLLVPATTD